MSNKLTVKEQDLSEDAIYYFQSEIDFNNIFKTRVKVVDGKQASIMENDCITVVIEKHHSWKTVAIMWEEAGFEREVFNRIGLYGTYSTGYNRMEFLEETNQLKIYSSNSDISILIDMP